MRPPVLVAVLLWLPGLWAEDDECHSQAESPGGQSGGPPLSVSVGSRGRAASLALSWAAGGPGRPSHLLRLSRLGPLGAPEGQQLQAHTNASSFEFQDLVPGSHYRLEVTVLHPCGQNATTVLTAHTAPATVQDLQLQSFGSPTSLQAWWGAAPGGQDSYQLLLYKVEPQMVAHNISMSPGTLHYNFSHLSPGSEYALEVTTWAATLHAKTNTHQWTDPVAPGQLGLHALGTSALQASWDGSGGAAWLHLVLTDLLGGPNLTAEVRRGVSNHTFRHLSPGTAYRLTLSAVAGPHWAAGPNTIEWTHPSAPLDLVLTPQPPGLSAHWRAGPGAQDGYLLRLSGLVETISLGPGALNATFPGPLPAGHYTLQLRVLAGPYDAWAQASAWLGTTPSPDAAAEHRRGNGTELPLDVLEATREPGDQALLYPEGSPGLPGNTSVPPAATQVPLGGHGALYQVDAVSSLQNTTQNLASHTGPLAPQSLEVIGRGSPYDLSIGWALAPGQREGYRVSWHQEGSQSPLGGLVDLGPDNSSLTLRGLVPGSCYTVSLWTWAGNLSSSIQRARACTLPVPPANLSLGLGAQPPALRASWSPPAGDWDGFLLRLYRLRPPALEGEETLAPEAQNFSWDQLAPGTEFLAWLATLRGPDESSGVNATGWTPPLAPPLVNVTSEGPTQLQVSWVHAPGGRDGYQVTLYQAGVRVGSSPVGAQVDGASFSALTPGTKYEVEVVAQAGPLCAAAANASGWTSPHVPIELLVSMQAHSAVVSLAWASPLGHGVCHALLLEAGPLSKEHPLVLGQSHLVLRNLTPGRNLSLSVLCQAGPLQATTHLVVLPVEPDPVEDVQCQPEATRLALAWTVPAGDVGTCLVVAEQLAAGGDAHLVFQAKTSRGSVLLSSLAPATSYRLSLSVLGRNGLWSRVVTLVCATSAQAWHPLELATAPHLEPKTGMGVIITPGMFGKDDGQIQWYGVIATTNMSLVLPPREAVNHTWYDHYYGGHDSYLAVLLPNPFYPGPWAVPTSWMVPMGTEVCGHTQDICNGQLKPGSQYRFSVVAFTRYSAPETLISFSAFSEPRASVSWAAAPVPAVVSVVAGCVLSVGAALGLLYWRRVKGQRADETLYSQELTVPKLRRTHRPIPVHSFRQSYEAKRAHTHQAFFQEFEELKEVVKEQPRLEAEHPANTAKNRYPHVLPYDHSRVRLTLLDGEPHSDYINASFIPGYTHPQEFIATQGPLKKTLGDFWRLVWEQQVRVIVMLTVGMENGRVLCEHYWPANPTPVTHGHITVHLLAEEPEEEWTKREFQLQHAAQPPPRRVKQLQFTTWPNHSVPEAPSSLLAFVELVREQVREAQGTGPILVHCSAGVGRSGTFVALSRLLQQLEEEQTVDVFHTVYTLRLHRPLMIQTPSQYVFLHSCLLSRILEGPPSSSEATEARRGSWGASSAPRAAQAPPRPQPIPVRDLAQACAERAADADAGFLGEYELLLQALKDQAGSMTPPPGCEQDGATSDGHCHEGSAPVEEGIPGEMPEAWLFPGGPSGRDHVVLTGPAGPAELWGLVWEHGARVLVSLCPPGLQEKEFWPTGTQPIVTDGVTVHWVAENSAAGWPCTLFSVTHRGSGTERPVQRLQFPHWEPGQELPATTLLPFLAAVGKCCSQDTEKPGTLLSHSRILSPPCPENRLAVAVPSIPPWSPGPGWVSPPAWVLSPPPRPQVSLQLKVNCSKGAAPLGTFLAVDRLLQQAGAEGTVDVFTVALQQSQACGLLTPTLEQYTHLYSCLNSALEGGLP